MATYESPTNRSRNLSSPGQHGRQHSRSHSRKAAPEPLVMPPRTLPANGPTSHPHVDPKAAGNQQSLPHSSRPDLQAPRSVSSTNANFSSPRKIAEKATSGMRNRSSSRSPASLHRRRQSELHSLRLHPEDDRTWPGLHGIVTALLIPTPFLLNTVLWSTTKQPQLGEESQSVETELGKMISSNDLTADLSFFKVCVLTSATLLFVGLFGEIQGSSKSNTPPPKSSQSIFSAGTLRRLLGRILSIGLPFYACSRIGGQKVAFIILITLASELMTVRPKAEDLNHLAAFRRFLWPRKWTVLLLGSQFVLDLCGLTEASGPLQTTLGYVALSTSIFLLPPPYPTTLPKASIVTSPAPKAMNKLHRLGSPLDMAADDTPQLRLDCASSPLISTPWDTDLTIASALVVAVVATCVFFIKSGDISTFPQTSAYKILLVSLFGASSLLFARVRTLRKPVHAALTIGLAFTVVLPALTKPQDISRIGIQAFSALAFWLAAVVDSRLRRSRSGSRHTSANHASHAHEHSRDRHSRVTGVLLHFFQGWPFFHSILSEKDSRRIFYFMTLNFAFMLVQTFYGYVSKSLGLLSDSVHMFFDCAALLVGLAAAVMSKWPPDDRFPYGYGMIDTLAGFANGVFLMLISLEIVYEAIERLVDGVQMQRIAELLIVSTLGLLVNCVGMLAFGHAHHGHGHDHSHHQDLGHDHGHKQHDHDHDQGDPQSHDHSHSHDNHLGHDQHHGHHHHSHGNENMLGIWLHILADTLGSAAVVFSTILVYYTGWPGFDPLASCLIAILIFASAIPLVTSSAKRLLLTIPESTEFDIREVLASVAELRGISSVTAPRFWMSGGEDGIVQGVMHVVISKGVDMEETRARVLKFLGQKRMNVLVQAEREGEGRCWCGNVDQRG